MHELPNISVIIPCYNEGNFIEPLVENILGQDYPKSKTEVIFIDGQSEDNTKMLIQRFAETYPMFKCLDNPERFVPQALNKALAVCTGEIVIRLDAHAIYPENYFSVLIHKLVEYNAENVGGMWVTLPGAPTNEARAIVLATSHPLGIGNAGYRLGAEKDTEVDTVPYGCFRRDLFNRIGYFDTDLSRNQDDEFNGRIRKAGGKIMLVPTLKIQYYARPDLRRLRKMFYQYGLFKPLVNLKLGSPASMRQFAPPLFVLSLFFLMVCSFFSFIALIFLTIEVLVYGIAIVYTSSKLTRNSGLALKWFTAITFPTIHFAYGIGYIFGIFRFVVFKMHLQSKGHSIKSNR